MFVLVHSPLLGPRSWAKVASLLRGAVVPDLRSIVATTPPPWSTLAAMAADLPTGAVVVGHAGAGALLPMIGAAADASALVFVDAVVPPVVGDYRPASGWATTACGYVRLSEAYDAEADEATRRGWPVVRIAGTHVDLLTHPAEVARAIRLVRSVLHWMPTFRPLTRADLPLMHRWVNATHVAQWWDPLPTIEDVEADFGPGIDGTDTTDYFAIEVGGRPVGMIQTYLIDDEPEYKEALGNPSQAAGIDLFIGEPDLTGHGLGPAVLHAFATGVVFTRWPAGVVDWCVAGPDHRNARSISAFEVAGFHRGAIVAVPGEPEPEQLMVLERV
jgi:aminoglycoside 6'-N-acetyltransferase